MRAEALSALLHGAKNGSDMYRSPLSGTITTMRLPAISARDATSSAA